VAGLLVERIAMNVTSMGTEGELFELLAGFFTSALILPLDCPPRTGNM
jgi:hypothetical protein